MSDIHRGLESSAKDASHAFAGILGKFCDFLVDLIILFCFKDFRK
jgi:hypothetical protein